MAISLATVTFLVRDYDEAIAWFQSVLEFELLEDTPLSATKRWVRVGLPQAGTSMLLAKADGQAQATAIGKAAGGRVAYFAHTQDFDRDHARMLALGVSFKEAPRREPYGTVAVFADLYGNLWDLIELNR